MAEVAKLSGSKTEVPSVQIPIPIRFVKDDGLCVQCQREDLASRYS